MFESNTFAPSKNLCYLITYYNIQWESKDLDSYEIDRSYARFWIIGFWIIGTVQIQVSNATVFRISHAELKNS
jgi:hypothetical protein